METTESAATLTDFRQTIYDQVLGHRKDTVFELMDAVLVAETAQPLVRLTVAPVFRRRWASAPDALAEGQVDTAALRRLLQGHLTADRADADRADADRADADRADADRADAEPAGGRPRWVIDGVTWPRPAAETSPERTWGHRVAPGKPQSGIVPSWEYQLLVDVPCPGTSWVRPLDVRRRGPTAGSPTELALAQLRDALALRPAGAPRPLVTVDSQYDLLDLARAVCATKPAERLRANLLLRLPTRRRFYRQPPPYAGKGRPRVHGAVFHLGKPATHGPPDHTGTVEDARHGTVRVDVWDDLHDQHDATITFPVIRIQVERLPKSGRRPQPLWVAWLGLVPLADPVDYWREYTYRFTVEHGIRFWKQALGWTTVRLGDPAAADRWSWLLVLVGWQLWLARRLIADQRLPWERPRPVDELTPGRVRRGMGGLLVRVGTPARAVRPRGKSPGRQPGQRPKPRIRYPTVTRAAARAA
jgi:hypothetical protein